VNPETLLHIKTVAKYLNLFSCELLKRAISHDQSKLEEPEASIFEMYTSKLHDTTYGSEEYKQFLKEMQPALEHHYANNRHHPEFNNLNGYAIQTLNDPIRSMDLFDIVEMILDWLASSKRHANGNIGRSIEINEKRFGINDQLSQIFRNTVARLEEMDKG
jgi:hypothetical protein